MEDKRAQGHLGGMARRFALDDKNQRAYMATLRRAGQAERGDLISRAKLRWDLTVWADKLRTAGECGGCEAELLRGIIRMVDEQPAAPENE